MRTQVSRTQQQLKNAKIAIWSASIAIPLVVAVLFGVKIEGVNLSYLPPFYAKINAITAFLLVFALITVKIKQYKMHERIMKICILLSLVFLTCYVAYHMVSESTIYGDANKNGELELNEKVALGSARMMYIILLVSHIVLSIAVVPIVLFSYLWAWQGNFERHKKWTRFAWPIWMYVAVTGVIVYFLISPFYT
jgi:putative membrane protein